MFIEIANRPKHVIIQKCTKANKWVDIAEISDRCGMDYDYLTNILKYPDNNSRKIFALETKIKNDSNIDLDKITIPASAGTVSQLGTVDMNIGGTFTSPKVSIDMESLAKQAAKRAKRNAKGKKKRSVEELM